ncbi:MAG TPA: TonB-dependent receptor plug domain-containing protein, partial [Flavobacterium sp.]
MKGQLLLITFILSLFTSSLFGQGEPITGRVVDNANLPLPGANVTIRGTQTGVDTDIDGNFTITAAPTDILVFSFLGMQTVELPARANMTVTLVEEATQIEGVVVTALGISREKRSLGYSAQKLEGSDVTQTPTNNFLNNLSGKVAGLEIRTNSNFGGSTNVVLRGTRSVSGNNQALIVVDGVPMNNSNLNTAQAASGRRGIDFGNSAADIDPNNIESITVLKGAAATALYGSQASNGAIMITTRKGGQNAGIGVAYSSTTSIGSFDRSTFPTYQKTYGQGYAGPDSFIAADVNGDGEEDLLAPTGDDASYGVAFDPNLLVYQWNAFAPGNPHFGQPTPWVAAQNDPRDFF